MEDDDKPFACPVIDCGMRFANEDHLTVHKKKHEMSLTLTPSTTFKNPFVDQTPTPTRVLNALETELFGLHADNPFDQFFRRANSLVASTGQITIPESSTANPSDSDALNTPSIPLTAEPEITVSTTDREANNISKRPVPRIEINNQIIDGSNDTLPFTPNNQPSSTTEQDEIIPSFNNNGDNIGRKGDNEDDIQVVSSTHIKLSAPSVEVATTKALVTNAQRGNGIRTNVVQTPVITSVGLSGTLAKTGVPTAVVVTRAVTSGIPTLSTSVNQVAVVSESPSQIKATNASPIQPVLQSVAVTPVVQLIIRLPDGQSMPVQIPVVTLPSAPATNTQPISTTASVSPRTSTSQSLAKMKLKEVLTLAQKTVSSSSNICDDSIQETSLSRSQAIHIMPSQNSVDRISLNGSPPPSPYPLHRPGSTGRRRRDPEEDPEEKRRKSLERNRAAATRCRQKRKQWIQALEKKADELACTNIQLQNEVSMLRNEVAQLKTMLLAHKDCPITLQQKASGLCEVTSVSTVPLHITRSQSPTVLAGTVDSDSITSLPLTVELMEVEVSSSQSGSVSDVNEMSAREQ